MSAINFLVCGVGGQGTVVASDILSSVGLTAGYQVKKSDVLGLAQRGGSVISHIRWDTEVVHAPMVSLGEIDFMVAFERLEALRRLPGVPPHDPLSRPVLRLPAGFLRVRAQVQKMAKIFQSPSAALK